MRCPKCGTETYVIDSRRKGRKGEVIRRRRLCKNCGHRLTTYEGEFDDWLKIKIDLALELVRRNLYKEFQLLERRDDYED